MSPKADDELDRSPRPTLSDASVAALVRLAYVALAVAAGGGLAGWAMYLQPDKARDIVCGLGGSVIFLLTLVFASRGD